MEICENIRRLRHEKHMTLEQLGKIAGVSKQTIQRYENGQISNIPYDKIVLLARALNVTPPELMGWSESPHFSSDDLRLLSAYHAATEEQKRIIAYVLKLDSENGKSRPE